MFLGNQEILENQTRIFPSMWKKSTDSSENKGKSRHCLYIRCTCRRVFNKSRLQGGGINMNQGKMYKMTENVGNDRSLKVGVSRVRHTVES